jgi:hypothetical protein
MFVSVRVKKDIWIQNTGIIQNVIKRHAIPQEFGFFKMAQAETMSLLVPVMYLDITAPIQTTLSRFEIFDFKGTWSFHDQATPPNHDNAFDGSLSATNPIAVEAIGT